MITFTPIINTSNDPTVPYIKLRNTFEKPRPTDVRRPMYKLTAIEALRINIGKQQTTKRGLERAGHLSKILPTTETNLNSILDVGCGNGDITSSIASVYDIPATDVHCADVFDPANFTGNKSMTYHQVVGNSLSFLPDQSIDLITAFVSMHHFEDFDAMMKEINRVLAPGGYFFFREHDVPTTRNEILIKKLNKMHEEFSDHPEGPINYLNRNNLKDTLINDYQLEWIGDSDYTGGNPQRLYHSLFKKSGKLSIVKTELESGIYRFLSPAGVNNYKWLTAAKNGYAIIRNFSKVRSAANPYENIPFPILAGNSSTRAGLKLANIDAVYGITMHRTGFLAKNSSSTLVFADLAGGPGSFSQYLLWRNTMAQGMGITIKDSRGAIPWNTKILDTTRFWFNYGSDGTGNLYTNTDSFPVSFLERFPDGADLVVADGGFSVDGREEHQEQLTTRLILCEILTAIKILGDGPSVFVCKVFDSLTLMVAQLLYLCANVFEQIDIFKPIASRPANSERYLICSGFRKASAPNVENILNQANAAYAEGKEPVSLLDNDLPGDFIKWLIERNDESMALQLASAREIIKLGQITNRNKWFQLPEMPVPELNLNRSLTVWNLPDGPDVLSTQIPRGKSQGSRSRPTKSNKLSRRR